MTAVPDDEVWAGIVRVSHLAGRGGESFHADRDQVADIERYARQRGARVVFMEPELSVSGGRALEERPPLREAIEGVESGRFTGIVVAYLSRLSRSRSGLEIWERVEAAGGHIHCAAENTDTSTPSGRFIRDIHLANAVREREEHAARFDLRRRLATEAGIWQRRQTPLGYTRDPATRRLVPDGGAQKVRDAFQARVNGVPTVQIADRLHMTPSGVRQLLKNRVYLGELKVGKYVNPTAHPPIIDVELFDQAQSTVRARPALQGRDRALLAGLVRCQGCGHVMSRGHGRSVVYGCHRRHSLGHCQEPAQITLRLLDDHVERIVLHELGELAARPVSDGGKLEDARRRVGDAERELRGFLDAVQAAGIDALDYTNALKARQRTLDEARRHASTVAAQERPVMDLDPVEFWETADVGERHALLRSLVEMVIVRRAGGPGARMPIKDRVRVIRFGAGLVPTETVVASGVAHPVQPMGFPSFDDPVVLGVPGVE